MRVRLIAVLFGLIFCNPLWSQVEREAFIADLLSQMTLEEKVGQMTNLGLTAFSNEGFWTDTDSLVLDPSLMDTYLQRFNVGSVQGKGVYPPNQQEWLHHTSALQEYARDHTRLGIPLLYGIDAVHGANYTSGATIFPHQIGLGATFDPELVKRIAQATSMDLISCGINWNFAPVLDLAWQPLWGRIEETFSADAYMTAKLGEAFIEGSQDKNGNKQVAACLKHLVGYSYPNSGKDRSPASISQHDLQQYFLSPFHAAVQAGALSIMLNSGSVNGIPGHIDSKLIRQVKVDWGFEGFIVSDWDDLSKLVSVHRVATDYKDATRQAVMAGMDMCMVPYDSTFCIALTELVQDGLVPMNRIDDAVTRILRVKYALGLWNKTYKDRNSLANHQVLALQAATESIILLKNEGVLPLAQEDKVVLAGPGANELYAMLGPWSRTWQGNNSSYIDTSYQTVFEAFQSIGKGNVSYVSGAYYDSVNQEDWVEVFSQADKIILVLGETPSTEKPSDIASLELPNAQKDLVKFAAASGKPVIAILLQGRPRLIGDVSELIDGIVLGFYPGQYGGPALARLFYGKENFSAKLPYTYPRNPSELKGYPYLGADMLDHSFGLRGYPPLYPFGYGISYSSYTYENMICSDTLLSGEQKLSCEITVRNTGVKTGKEIVQWYLQDEKASVTPVLWRMVGCDKITLAPGESKTVKITLGTEQLQMVDQAGEWIVEPGFFKLGVGPNSEQLTTHRFMWNSIMD